MTTTSTQPRKTTEKQQDTDGLLTKPELIAALDVSISTLGNYLSMGMPVTIRGKQGKASYYDLDVVQEWIQENNKGVINQAVDAAKLEKLQLEIALAEVRLAKEKGELIEIDAVIKQLSAVFTRVKSRLLAIPSSLSGILCTLGTPAEIEAALDDAIRDVLDELVFDFDTL